MSENTQQILTEPENKLPEFTFDQLPPMMHQSIEKLGWSTPMPVQAKAVPYLLDNRDMIVQSRTGSGKTGAFLIPVLMRIDPGRRHPQALVLVPTRELAGQVYKEFQTLGQDMNVEGALLYGGVGYNTQLQSLRSGAQVIIGTPGRVLDHIGRRSLNLDRLNIIVFDEADEMLSMGFYPDMRELRRYLPRDRSSWMFSATMPYKVQLLAREFLREPEFLSLSSGDVTVSTMEHRFYDVPPLEKDIMLMRLIELENPDSVIIFCNTKVEVEYVATVLRNYGYNADQLSGDLDQKSRERAMGRIRNGETRFLVATDVAARGIDISDLSHVIQYDVPKDPDSYVHRAGRTARAGNTGVVITFIANMSEKSDLKKIARRYNVEFVELPAPTAEEVAQRMGERLTIVMEDRFRTGITRLERERMKRFLPLAKSLAESEDESMLLAMLLDNLYHDTFHHAPVPAPEIRADAPPQRQQESRQQEQRPQESRSKERSQDRSQERSERPQERSQDRPQERLQERPEEVPQDQLEGELPVEGEKKRKKRKRKRKRNRGGEGQPMPGESQMEQSDIPAGESEGDSPVEQREPQPQQQKEQRPRDERPRDERPRDERPRDERPRDERPRDERPRDERPRNERPRDERPRDERPRDERSKDHRPKERSAPPREEKKERPGSTQITSDSPWVDSIQVIEPESWVEPEMSQKPQEKRREERPRGEEKRPEPQAAAETGKARESGSKKETPAAATSDSATKGRKSSTKPGADASAAEPADAAPSGAEAKSSRKGSAKETKGKSAPADAAEAPATASKAKKSSGGTKKETASEPAPATTGKGTKAAQAEAQAASTKKAAKGGSKESPSKESASKAPKASAPAAEKKGRASKKDSGDEGEPKATKRGKSK